MTQGGTKALIASELPPKTGFREIPVRDPENPATLLAVDCFLARLDQGPGPQIGIGAYGPFLPQIMPAAPGAYTREHLNADVVSYQNGDTRGRRAARSYEGQPGFLRIVGADKSPAEGGEYKITPENVAEVNRYVRAFDRRRPARWHPGRHPSLCMSASAAHHLLAKTFEEIGDDLPLANDMDKGRDHHRDPVRRNRAVKAMVAKGGKMWFELGAWPWAAFSSGVLLPRWQEDVAALEALNAWRWKGARA